MVNIYSSNIDSLNLFLGFQFEYVFFLVCLILHAGIDSEAQLSMGAVDLNVGNHFSLSVLEKMTFPFRASLQRSFLNFDVILFAILTYH